MSWEYEHKNIEKPPILGQEVIEALDNEDPNIFQAWMNYIIRIDKCLSHPPFSDEENKDRKNIIDSINMYYADLERLNGELNNIDTIKGIMHAFKVILIKMEELKEN